MHLTSVEIKNFRSIQNLELRPIGDFNVLVGKNNAGKSNILLCISRVLPALEAGNVVSVEDPFSNEDDFFCKDVTKPIEVSLGFYLSSQELAEIMSEISSEVPEMARSLEDVVGDAHLSLRVVCEHHLNGLVTYVQTVSLGSVNDSWRPREIAVVSSGAAKELKNLASERELVEGQLQIFEEIDRTIDEDNWSAIKGGERYRLQFLVDRQFRGRDSRSARKIIPPAQQRIAAAVDQSESYVDFKDRIRSYAQAQESKLLEITEKKVENEIRTITGSVHAIPTYLVSIIKRVGASKVHYLKERRADIGIEEARKLLDLKIRRGGPEQLLGIQRIVKSLLGVNVDAFRADPSVDRSSKRTSRAPNFEAELDVDGFLVELNGSGVREALRIVLDFEFFEPDIFLIEEPEIHLHPGLEKSIRQYLKDISARCQVVITTHFTNLITSGDEQNVFVVKKDKADDKVLSGASSAKLVLAPDLAEHLPRELGLDVSSLFMYERILFVEGVSDEHVFRKLAERLDVNLSSKGVGILPMGGSRNITYYAVADLVSYLFASGISSSFVIDRDERSEGDVNSLRQRLDGKAELHVLQKRELENYFLNPEILSKHIRARCQSANIEHDEAVLSADHIKQRLNDIVEKFQGVVLAKRLKAATNISLGGKMTIASDIDFEGIEKSFEDELNNRLERLKEAKGALRQRIADEKSMLESEWEQRRESLVPGSEVLNCLFREYGLAYKKDRDGPMMCGFMSRELIPGELVEVLEAAARVR